MEKLPKIILYIVIILGSALGIYIFAPLHFIVNLEQVALNIIFIMILGGFIVGAIFIQEGIGKDKASKQKIKRSDEL